ncbi:MAG: NAD+ synthase (glutamine-hydrolyzing) [Planctomycetota bacterium]|jgi:NAD+ synthase (glutamine-hydrolysing)
MRIALAQINTTQGDVNGNINRIRKAIEVAHRSDARIVIFPELSICGYCPRDVLFQPSFVARSRRAAEKLAAEMPKGITALVGSIRKPDPISGRRVHNSVCLIESGKVTVVADKQLLPNYDVFDEARYFVPGSTPDIIDIDGLKIGVTICEDIWGNVSGDPGMPNYNVDPVSKLVEKGAQLLVNLSASPYSLGKIETRKNLIRSHAQRSQLPVVMCNLVGGNDEVIFDGSSCAFADDGTLIAEGKSFAEDLLIFDHEAKESSISKPLAEYEELRQALVLGVRDYAHKSGFKSAILGLSGGIDSALTAAIASEALGADKVMGVSMPSQYSAAMSHDDAKEIADNLGMPFCVIPIGPVFDAALGELTPHFDGQAPDVTEENIQPRIRGMYLMALSNKHGSLLLSTGNKSELAVGYCTLYGDMCGGLAVLSDLPKHRVYGLSNHFNSAGIEVIPQRTIDRPPSAELREDQKDSDTLPDYDELDEILRLAIEEGEEVDGIVAKGFDKTTVKDILSRLWRNEFKRKQMPPGLKVTSKAFGIGRRMPLTGGVLWCDDEDKNS